MNTTASKRAMKGESLLASIRDFTAIDIETTGLDPEYDEIIELAAIRYRNGVAAESFQSLVKPNYPIDDFVEELTGITNQMLESAPSIEDILPAYTLFLADDVLVGHNINFDINFIYDACCNIGIAPIGNDFIDTMRIARRLYKDWPNHKLDTMVSKLGFPPRDMHRGTGDAELSAGCYLAMINHSDFNQAVASARSSSCGVRAKDIISHENTKNIDSPLYGQVCVFTGALESFTRREAMQLVADIGGICGDSVTKKTNFLILGNNDYCKSIKDGKSSKQKKAEKLILEGADLKIISESVFLDMLESFEPDPIKRIEKLIIHSLDEVLASNGLTGLSVTFDQLKNTGSSSRYVIKLGDRVIAYIVDGKNKISLELSRAGTIELNSIDDIENYLDDIKEVLQSILNSMSKDFSCCSRYMECSDARACVHPDKDVALGCHYRKVLSNGQVFYGKNRNIE